MHKISLGLMLILKSFVNIAFRQRLPMSHERSKLKNLRKSIIVLIMATTGLSSALVRVRNKIRRSDARIAFAMPPRIGANIMMVMCKDTHHSIEKK